MIETADEALTGLRFGFVTALDEARHAVRVQLPDLELETWWLPVLVPGSRADKHFGLPDIGEHVAVLLDRRGETGVCLGSIYSARDAVPVTGAPDRHHIRFADGTTIDYDRRTHRLAIHCVGDVEIVSGTHIALRAPRIDLN
jgi:phage baseplate assembly protein V